MTPILARHYLTILVIAFNLPLGACVSRSQATVEGVELTDDGDQYLSQGNFRDAISYFKDILKTKPRDGYTNRNLGIAYVRVGDYNSALRHLETAIKSFPEEFETNFYLGEAYRASGQYADAIFRYKKATELQRNHLRALKGLAWSYFKIRYVQEALATISLARKNYPADGQAAIIHSRILLNLKREKEALAVIKQAKAESDNAYLPFFMSVEGEIHLERKDFALASKLFREALKSQPLLPGSLLGLGKCFLEEGNTVVAVDYFQRALRIKPNLQEAYLLLSLAYEKSAPEKAEKYLRRFSRMAENDPKLHKEAREVGRRINERLNSNTRNTDEQVM
jgi:tetratricopeptide (TPR) repeat protein